VNSIQLTGVGPSGYHDDRTTIYLRVTYSSANATLNVTDEIFNWSLNMPPTYTGSFGDFIALKEQLVYNDIETKLQQWHDLDPKTREVEGMMPGETITIDIQREEIVCPTYPDYYVKRAMEYPTPANQLDAYWKGGVDRDAMQAKIDEIKAKYPKDSP
jgi:hypothetical protein